MNDRILEIEDRILEITEDVKLVIITKQNLQTLSESIENYMCEEFAAADSCMKILNKIQNGLIRDLNQNIANAILKIGGTADELLEDEYYIDQEAGQDPAGDQEGARMNKAITVYEGLKEAAHLADVIEAAECGYIALEEKSIYALGEQLLTLIDRIRDSHNKKMLSAAATAESKAD